MHRSIPCPRVPPPPPGRWWGFYQGGGQMYPKSPPGNKRNGQTAPPRTRGDHSADWRRSMCPTPVTHLVVKFPTPDKAKRSNPPWSPGGGGGGGGLQLIGAIPTKFWALTYSCVVRKRDILSGFCWVWGRGLRAGTDTYTCTYGCVQ